MRNASLSGKAIGIGLCVAGVQLAGLSPAQAQSPLDPAWVGKEAPGRREIPVPLSAQTVVLSARDYTAAREKLNRPRPRPSPYAFHLHKDDRVVLIGDTLIEREQSYGQFEARLTVRYPRKNLVFRNLGWSADDGSGRSWASFDWTRDETAWFEKVKKQIGALRPSVVIIGYGMSSSFEGEAGLADFRRRMKRLLDTIRELGKPDPIRVVILGPVRHENLGGDLPDPAVHNAALEEYSEALHALADSRQIPFVDLFHWLGDGLRGKVSRAYTDDGIHPNEYGYSRMADVYQEALRCKPWPWMVGIQKDGSLRGGSTGATVSDMTVSRDRITFTARDDLVPFPNLDADGKVMPTSIYPRMLQFRDLAPGNYAFKVDGKVAMIRTHRQWGQGQAVQRGPAFEQAQALLDLIVRKNRLFFNRWRPENQTYLFGFRKHEQGKNAVEIPQFDPLIAELENQISRLAIPKEHHYELIRVEDGWTDQDVFRPVPLIQRRANREPEPFTLIRGKTDAKSPLEFIHSPEIEIHLFARNPLLSKPIQMNFDPAGRLWVASSSVYPQIKPGQSPNDKILVLEDADHDGVAERSTVFADGLLIPTGVEPGDGGAYVSQSTQLLHFKDVDGDGRADQKRIVLSGFGTEDTHHILHTLRWGYDGQLYMDQSIYIHSHIETPHGVVRLNSGGIYHFRPSTMELGVFLRGFCNPWGHAFDAYGQSFVTDGAGFQGLSYGLPGAMYFTYAGARRVLDSISPGSYPKYCGLAIIQSDHFPKDWQGSAVTCDFRAHRIVRFSLSENGAGYAAQELPELVRGTDNTFRPVDVKLGPDGALYVADWSNPIIQHGEVDFRDPRRDKVHGRIWRITYKNRPLRKPYDFTKLHDEALLGHLISPNEIERRQARRVLTERGKTIRKALRQWTQGRATEKGLLEALWTYQAIDQVEPELLHRLLNAKDGRIRAAAVRVLRFWHGRIPESQDWLAEAIEDDQPRVRIEAMRALSQIPSMRSAEGVLRVLDHPMDRFLDYGLWLSINDLADPWIKSIRSGRWRAEGREAQLAFGLKAIEPKKASQVLEQFLSHRPLSRDGAGPWIELIGAAGRARDLRRLYQGLVEGEFSDDAAARALKALGEAYRIRGLRPTGEVGGLSSLFESGPHANRAAAVRLAGVWGLSRFTEIWTRLARDEANPPEVRLAAVEALRDLGSAKAFERLAGLTTEATDLRTRQAAVKAMAAIDLGKTLPVLFRVLQATDQEKDLLGLWRAVLRLKGAKGVLIKAFAKGKLAPRAARAGIRAAHESGKAATELLLAFERAGGLDSGSQRFSGEYMRRLADEAEARGDPWRGETIFRRQDLACTTCHAIGGVGGKVGPDLTSIGASAPADYLVESLLAPNAKVKEGYQSVLVETNDGDSISGVLVREGERELLVRNAADQEISIAKKDIFERTTGGSIMPAGLVDQLHRQDQLDLVKFLSRLGKQGPFDASRANVARVWWLRAGRHTEEQFGFKAMIRDVGGTRWRRVPTQVDGRLNQAWMARSMHLNNINQGTSLIGVFAATRLELPEAAAVTFDLEAPEDSAIWIDDKGYSRGALQAARLAGGIHTVIVRLDPLHLPGYLRLKADKGTFLVE